MHIVMAALLFLVCFVAGGQTKPQGQSWDPVQVLIGKWEGTGKGEPGVSKVQREYRFVLNSKFIQVQNRSSYDPQPKNPKGEVHEDWGMISFDKRRKQFVLRQFHVEGFVNQYVMTSSTPGGKVIVFNSESIENIPSGYRARETYKILSADEFVEIFELAEPGKDFALYSETHFKRKSDSSST